MEQAIQKAARSKYGHEKTRQPDIAGLAVDLGAHVVFVAVFRTGGLLDRLFHGIENLFGFNSLVPGDGLGNLE